MNALDRRFGDDDQIGALIHMRRGAVRTVDVGRAHRTRLLHLRTEHEAVDQQAVLVTQPLGQTIVERKTKFFK